MTVDLQSILIQSTDTGDVGEPLVYVIQSEPLIKLDYWLRSKQ